MCKLPFPVHVAIIHCITLKANENEHHSYTPFPSIAYPSFKTFSCQMDRLTCGRNKGTTVFLNIE